MVSKDIESGDTKNSEPKNSVQIFAAISLGPSEMDTINKIMSEKNLSSIDEAISEIIAEYKLYKKRESVEYMSEMILENQCEIETLNQNLKAFENKLSSIEALCGILHLKLYEDKTIDLSDAEYLEMDALYNKAMTELADMEREALFEKKEG